MLYFSKKAGQSKKGPRRMTGASRGDESQDDALAYYAQLIELVGGDAKALEQSTSEG